MTKNLGSRDAALVNADREECQAGCCVELDDAAAQWLIAKGFAVEVEAEPVKAVPAEPTKAQPQETLKGVSNKQGK